MCWKPEGEGTALPIGSRTDPNRPIGRGLVVGLGVGQLVGWGVSYYLIGVFGHRIAAELGWSASRVHAGFSLALLIMGLVSPAVGRAVDRRGGRAVMVAGSILTAAGCVLLASAHGAPTYYAAWALLGLAMRAALYDAAFAALVRVGGAAARRPIAQITLLGGLSSTVFWPVGDLLAGWLGWRGALLVYAGAALLTIPLHLRIPAVQDRPLVERGNEAANERTAAPPATRLAAVLYAVMVTLGSFLTSGLGAHMIGLLQGLGLAASIAVWAATLVGIGQATARLGEVLLGARLHPLNLAVLASAFLPTAFLTGLLIPSLPAVGLAFVLLYGAGNGLSTIIRGTLPLVLFDASVYGSLVGRLLAPGFYLSALAPLAYATTIEHLGPVAALWLSAACGVVILTAALVLRLRFRPHARAALATDQPP